MLDIRRLTNQAEMSLVDFRQQFWSDKVMFCTISPNPNLKHKCLRINHRTGKRVNVSIPYGKLPQSCQYEYCMNVLKSAYNFSNDTKLFGTWELNKKGDVHFHFIMSDPRINSEDMLQVFRRDVLNTPIVLLNLGKQFKDWMNNIVFVNDTIYDRIKYMTKSNNLGKPFPYYCTYNTLCKISDIASLI